MCYVQGRPFLGQRIRCWEPPDYSCPAATTVSTSRWQKHSGGKQNTRNPCDNTGRYASSEESLVWNCLPTLNCHVTWTEFGWGGRVHPSCFYLYDYLRETDSFIRLHLSYVFCWEKRHFSADLLPNSMLSAKGLYWRTGDHLSGAKRKWHSFSPGKPHQYLVSMFPILSSAPDCSARPLDYFCPAVLTELIPEKTKLFSYSLSFYCWLNEMGRTK